jgi:hypothetical protein
VETVMLTNPPTGYDPFCQNLLQTLLLNSGYSITRAELSSLISITSDTFEERIDAWEKRKLKQARQAGLTSGILEGNELSTLYEFIKRCRHEKGYTISMNAEEISRLAKAFPDRIMLSAVYDDRKLAAASIALRVRSDILYNFYSDHHVEFDSLSPVVMVINTLYEFSQVRGIRILDLGTSAINQKPNFPLLDFKLRLGAVPSTKFTFTKEL